MLPASQLLSSGNSNETGRPRERSLDVATQALVRDAQAEISSALAEVQYWGRSTCDDGMPPFNGSGLATRSQPADLVALRVDFPQRLSPERSSTLHALQEWEGYVLEIREEEFEARLIDVTADASHEGEEATIPLEELSDHDAKKMRVGSIFRWVIGYERSPAGTKKRVSHIVFRDLPAITNDDKRHGEIWVRKMSRLLGS